MKYPIYPITFSYVNGIFFANIFATQSYALFIYLISFVCLCILFYNAYIKFKFNTINSSISVFLFCWIFFSFGIVNFNNEKNFIQLEDNAYNSLVIREELKSTKNYHRYYAEILEQDNCKILLYLSNKQQRLKVGDVILDNFSYQSVPKSTDLFAFDYANYLSNKKIHYQTFLFNKVLVVDKKTDFHYYLSNLRVNLLDSFNSFYSNSDDVALIAGLLFGQKLSLSDNINSAYTNAGVMHVLAVSGMHIVIIFGFLNFILKRFTSNKLIIYTIIVFFLIVFAFLSGLSASVVRAVLMSCIFMIADVLNRKHFTTHSMVLSMLFLLVISPLFLFDIGFQLSYLAVFSIVFIYPLFQLQLKKSNIIIKFISETLLVSLAAQLGVMFLSVYYFNQFPIWFLIGNFVAIPLTSLVLILLLIQLPFNYFFPFISSILSDVISFLIKICNDFLLWMNTWSYKVIDNIFISWIDLFVYTTTIFFIVAFIRFKKIKYLFLVLVLFVCKYLYLATTVHFLNHEKMYVVGNKDRLEVLHLKQNTLFKYYNRSNVDSTSRYLNNFLVTNEESFCFDNYLDVNNSFYILDDEVLVNTKIKYDYLILKDNPIIRLDMVDGLQQCKLVIIHPNNTISRAKTWKEYLSKSKIPFHDMREKGYVIIE